MQTVVDIVVVAVGVAVGMLLAQGALTGYIILRSRGLRRKALEKLARFEEAVKEAEASKHFKLKTKDEEESE